MCPSSEARVPLLSLCSGAQGLQLLKPLRPLARALHQERGHHKESLPAAPREWPLWPQPEKSPRSNKGQHGQK